MQPRGRPDGGSAENIECHGDGTGGNHDSCGNRPRNDGTGENHDSRGNRPRGKTCRVVKMSYEKTGFFAALAGTCRGTDVFFRLVRQHPLRTMGQFLLLMLLCSLFVSLVHFFATGKEVDQAAARFQNTFGGLSVQGNRFLPELEPQQARSLLLPDGGILAYVPPGSTPNLPEKAEIGDCNYLLYWFPEEFLLGKKIAENEWITLNFRPGAVVTEQSRSDLAGFEARLRSVAANQKVTPATADQPARVIAVGEMAGIFKTSWTLIGFLLFFVFGAIQIIFYVGVFVGMFHLTGARQLRVLRFRDLFTISVYAGFPAMLVASVFAAFELPLLNFGSAYVIGMVLYMLTVVNRIEREAAPPAPPVN